MDHYQPHTKTIVYIVSGVIVLALLSVPFLNSQKRNKHSDSLQTPTNHLQVEMVNSTDATTPEGQIRERLQKAIQNSEWKEALDLIEQIPSTAPDYESILRIQKQIRQEYKEKKDLSLVQSPHFEIATEAEAAYSLLDPLTEILEIHYDKLCSQFNFRPKSKLPVVLYENPTYGGVGVTQKWVEASFDGKLRIPTAVMTKPERNAILLHELTHAFLWELGGNNIPVWLQEGLAQWIEDKRPIKDSTYSAPTYEDMQNSFGKIADVQKAQSAYTTSLKMIEILQSKGAWPKMNEFLTALQAQKNIELSLEEIYQTNSQDLYRLATQ